MTPKIRIGTNLIILCIINALHINVNTGVDAYSIDIADQIFGYAKTRYLGFKFQDDPENLATPVYPHYTDDASVWKLEPKKSWIVGFLPSIYWTLSSYYAGTGYGMKFQNLAEKTQEPIRFRATDSTTHDVGFVIRTPFHLALQHSLSLPNNDGQSANYRGVLLTAATTLAQRFDPVVGCVRSWENKKNEPSNYFKVVIDTMLNLELLFEAATLPGGNPQWRDIAVSHCEHTLKNHVRDDFSTYHLVIFDSNDGTVISRRTAQGYSDNSTWSRGHAWAIKGFTIAYKYTNNADYLNAAKQLAIFYMSRLPTKPASFVPLWDFNAPGDPYNVSLQDTSAAAVVASTLLDLSCLLKQYGNPSGDDFVWADKFSKFSYDTFDYLYARKGDYFDGERNVAVLQHGTSNTPKYLVDSGLIDGDDYLLEGLLKTGQGISC
ncbi:hypothetical protein HDU76_007104 [Blyttiomyces sp. JEL0837]|nr:hypothetical protein HDU76_007104 [Blyttiomyces sp. JEL0837]